MVNMQQFMKVTSILVAGSHSTTEFVTQFLFMNMVTDHFKELMQNEKVRKGIISAILSVDPKDVDSSKQPLSINHLFFFPNKPILHRSFP